MHKRNALRIITTVVCAIIALTVFLTSNALADLVSQSGEHLANLEGCPPDLKFIYSPQFNGLIENQDESAWTDRYNCCTVDHVRCPRWFKTSVDFFVNNVDKTSRTNAYSAGDVAVCTGEVYWSGTISRHRSGGGNTYYLENPVQGSGQYWKHYTSSKIYELESKSLRGINGYDIDIFNRAMRNEQLKGNNIQSRDALLYVCANDGTPPPPPPPDDLDPCTNAWSPNQDANNQTQVTSFVRNFSTNTGWQKESYVWAKPSDQIDFKHCYYGGVQKDKDTAAHAADVPHSDNECRAGSCPLDSSKNETVTMPPASTVSAVLGNNFQNKFDISGENSFADTKSFTLGDSSIKTYEHTFNIASHDPGTDGGRLSQKITSGTPSDIFINPVNNAWSCNKYYTGLKQEYQNELDSYDAKLDAHNLAKGTPYEASWPHPGVRPSFPKDEEHYNTAYSSCSRTSPYLQLITSDPVSSFAYVKVPYNYVNSGTAGIATDKIYAGEKVQIYASVETSGRYNSVTQGEYATRVPSARWKVTAFVSATPSPSVPADGNCANIANEGCTVFAEGSGSLNDSAYDYSSHRFVDSSSVFNVWDAYAGRYFCVVTSVWPSASHGDTDLGSGGNDSWTSGDPSCKVIHKKPTFQVWGGDIFTNGGLKSNTPTKNNVAGYPGYPYNKQSSNVAFHFEAFGEHNVLAKGKIQGVFSGNASGFAESGSIQYIGPKGNCARVPLSFSNGNCADTGNSGISSGTSIYDSIMTQFGNTAKNKTTRTGTVDISDTFDNGSAIGGTNVRYTHVANGAHIVASTFIPAQTSHIVYADGNLVIDSNLLYNDGLAYTEARQVPQLIIIAAGNIEIRGNVTQIDGWLLSKGVITTGQGQNADGNAASMLQLRINGPVYARQIVLNRAYGATKGSGSGNPAEVMNYSPFVYLYNANRSTDTPTLYTTYLKEVAPRY